MISDGYDTYCASIVTSGVSDTHEPASVDAYCGCLEFLRDQEQRATAQQDASGDPS